MLCQTRILALDLGKGLYTSPHLLQARERPEGPAHHLDPEDGNLKDTPREV